MNARKNAKRACAVNSGSDRKHLTGREVEQLIGATKGSRNEARDHCLLLLMFRHGLRVSEACRLKLDQVDIDSRILHVTRLKGGLSTTHPLRGDELRAIAGWLKERGRAKPTGKIFFVNASSAGHCIDPRSICFCKSTVMPPACRFALIRICCGTLAGTLSPVVLRISLVHLNGRTDTRYPRRLCCDGLTNQSFTGRFEQA
jgi:integrase-like protein